MVVIRTIVFSLLLCCIAGIQAGLAQRVYVQYDSVTPQASYAFRQLKEALLAQKYTVLEDQNGYDYLIRIEVDTARLESESFAIIPEQNTITIRGGDNRGMIYGSFSLAESLQHGTKLQQVRKQSEKPHYPFRAIKHNTPWYSYRPSSALDQHYETVRDVRYWEAFLDIVAENRFNSLSLWNLHPFVYMISPKNFPAASPFSEAEMKEWQQLHQEIFRMAHERAIDTYIIPFNIFVSPEFAKAYGVAHENVYPNYYVSGDTSEIVKRYMRESITQLLQEYPTLTGMGLTLGEGMAGMTPQQREDWIYDTYIEGMRQVGRPLKLVHRIPFSSTTESLGATSVDLERLTRKSIEREANLDFIQEPIWADLKYNWSHAHSTPKLVKVHGGEMFDTFYNPMPEGYKITYTARNEDFFALRWGVPDFIRAHVAQNSQPYVGGYFIGSETYIPAKDYFTAVEAPVDWQWAFERQWLFYKLWGRLLYNPATSDRVFQNEFTMRYGKKGKDLLQAYSLASSTQLRLASLYDSRWDFTLYGEGFMALIGDSTQYISVDALINQPTLDPDYVSVKDYVQKSLAGNSFGEKSITPPVLIRMLERDSRKALRLVKNIDTMHDASLMYEVADVKTWANLGLHLAEKLKGAVALQTYRMKGGKENQQKAVAHLQKALEYWDEVIKITRPIYKDMPLTHYNGSSHDRNDNNLFHWARIRPEVARDIDIAKEAIVQAIK
ncbi:hypothetical protein DXT99_01445 [Pontibacter diazotrophicus]|uniref:Beta-hexosaminidase bacterial type N-terminal domain-containing protein n=1 Tax=Pontibacter diazotrophicus TaxID=1400979 RepID=A0A3D8LIC7_9BACT|nr:hypothetical protein [Pontibacter diazotrophicus]RDV17199.1 hypothetical protein DXT99_01445 [Pontibacter diazotrophicus]